jgi:transposase
VIGGKRYADDYFSSPIGPCNASYSAIAAFHSSISACAPIFQPAVRKILRQIDVEIVKRSDIAKGFAVLPKRWIVERTIAWLNRCRRLAKDWECLNRKALAFLRLASIRLMLRKLCQKTA